MKRILALLMALALMATCIVTVSASTEVTATVATVEGPFSEGDEIAIPINISEWANAYATIDITIPEYDETLLTFDGFETSSTDFGGALTASGPLGFALVASPSSQRAAEKVDGGEICIMYFIANQDINVSTSVSVVVAVNGYTVGEEDNWVENRTLTIENVAGGIYVEEDPTEVTATVATIDGPFSEGDEIAIPITITEWANAYATIDITIPEYDEELLTFDGFEASSTDFGGALTASGPLGFALVASPSTDRAAAKVDGGEVCIMYFYALQDINVSTSVSVVVAVNGYTVGEEDNWIENRTLTITNVAGGVYIEGGDDPSHTCTPAGEIQYDETHHWYNCEDEECEEQVNKAVHEGGTATCISKAVCSVCNQEYGSIDSTNHLNTEVRDTSDIYTGDTWCTDCNTMIQRGYYIGVDSADATVYVTTVEGPLSAGDEIAIPVNISKWANAYAIITVGIPEYDEELLTFSGIESSEIGFGGALTASGPKGFALIASPCSKDEADKLLGGEVCVMYFVAKQDIEHSTTISVAVEANGYTVGEEDNWNETKTLTIENIDGGIYVEEPHVCTPGELKYDETNHWYVCADENCGNILNESTHEGGTATCCAKAECTVCGQEYGQLDANNHSGETEVRDAVAADCFNEGYSGDTYCLGCNAMITEGTVIPATGEHIGGTATCCAKAECTVCGNEYGEFDANNHSGETEVRDAVAADCGNEGYSGDTYCLGCNAMIAEGTVIPATGEHIGGTATCCAKAECTVCGNEYGEFDADNHSGGTEIRDASETYTGDTYCLGCGEKIADGYDIDPDALLGDVNGDGQVNTADARLVSQYYAGLVANINTYVADVNGDGNINTADARLIAQYYAGLIEEFSAE